MESTVCDLTRDDPASAASGRRYSLRQAAEIAGVSPRRLRSWVRAGLIETAGSDGRDGFSFVQVQTARVLAKLAQSGVGTRRLRGVLDQLRARHADPHVLLSQLGLFAGVLTIRDDDSRLAAPDGQLLLDLAADREVTATLALKRPPIVGAPADEFGTTDLFAEGARLEAAGDFEAAANAYRESLLQSGPELAACFNLANVLAELGRLDAATERYRMALEIDPGYAPAWNNLGLCLAEAGAIDEAVAAWRRAVELDPHSADAVFNLADALQETGRFAEARPHWEACLRLDGDNAWTSYAQSCLDEAPPRKR